MKIERFVSLLEAELTWRNKEINEFFRHCKDHDSQVLNKSKFLIIYSHWEGFIKNSSNLYLQYVSEQKVKVSLLTLNYKSIAIKGIIKNCYDTQNSLSLNNELIFIQKYAQKANKPFNFKAETTQPKGNEILNTKHNLSHDVFINFCQITGIAQKDSIKLRKHYIDEFFVSYRNAISHGEQLQINANGPKSMPEISHDQLEDLRWFILTVLVGYKEDLRYYASEQLYLLEKNELKEAYDIESENLLRKDIKSLDMKDYR